mmetsp:Transcript_60795/g.144036  ORF Transcript_60795/g.144036 Transcript_60795/m.144036 type:complete len:236 (+) Transcript_60795:1-708(+)
MRAALLLVAVASAQCFQVGPSLGLRTASPALRCPAVRAAVATVARRTGSSIVMQGGAWGKEEEAPQAVKELMQVRMEGKVDATKLMTWIQGWPFATVKSGYGLPKLMLPVDKSANKGGVKLVWKGTADPWMQVDLEGDTVRVYRQSKMSTSMLQVSALKEREEKKICDKLKEDLVKFATEAGVTGLNEKELPKDAPKVDATQPGDDAEAAAEDAPAAEEPPAPEAKDEATPPTVA